LTPTLSRAETAARLADGRFDVLVIGAGIVGAGIAAQAARDGLAVALVDRGDFGAETSAASSKLIHGGLRYLTMGDFGLVREAHRERRLLMDRLAPHLVRRLEFLLPIYRGGPFPPLVVHAGVTAYGALARSRLSRPLSPARARAAVPALRTEGLRSCARYADAVTHDSRLCLANVRAAHEAGAVVAGGAAVEALRVEGGRVRGAEVDVDGERVAVEARAVVNAAGPWVDEVRRLEDPGAGPSVRLSKGVHLLLDLPQTWEAALVVSHDRVRVSFAVPWLGMLLLGTTDTEHDGPPGELAVSAAETERVLAEAAVAVEAGLLGPEAIRSSFAGLRVLPRGEGDAASVRREAVVTVGRAGMLTVAGGKLTTYRSLAAQVLDRLEPELRPRRRRPPEPLPGAISPAPEVERVARLRRELPRPVVEHLVRLYGSHAADVLAGAAERPELLEPIHPSGPDVLAQVVYAAREEWARSADDVLRRRTTVAFRGGDTPEVRARVEALLGSGEPGARSVA
jgi:glycerol-3-phosphate dehydrogenase